MSGIALVDLGEAGGNLASVAAAFRHIGRGVHVTRDPAGIAGASAVVLPGVGAFGDAMRGLREAGLVEPIVRHATTRPLLGICVGMQLLGSMSSEHGEHEGLGLVPGRVERIDTGLRVPNMGWCDVTPARDNPICRSPAAFYFAHSYHLRPTDPADVAATIDYGASLTAVVQRGSVLGVQFHPEKSQDAGLDVLDAFCRLVVDGS